MKTINVMGIEYEIVQVSVESIIDQFADSPHLESVKKLLGEKGENFAGLCDAQSCKIYINIDLPYEKKKKTLIHEFIEAVDQESITELAHVEMQALTNALFLSGIVNVEELLKLEPEDIEISIASDPTG